MGVNKVLVYCISIQKLFLCSDIWQGIHKQTEELGQRKEGENSNIYKAKGPPDRSLPIPVMDIFIFGGLLEVVH